MGKRLVKKIENEFQDIAPTIRDIANNLENEKFSEDARLEAIRTLMPLIGRMRAGISVNEGSEEVEVEIPNKVDEASTPKDSKDYLVALDGLDKKGLDKALKEAFGTSDVEVGEWVKLKSKNPKSYLLGEQEKNKYQVLITVNEKREDRFDIRVKFDESAEEVKTVIIKAADKLGLVSIIDACKRAGVDVISRTLDENCIEIEEESVEKVRKEVPELELLNEEELSTIEVPNDAGLEIRLDREIFGNYIKEPYRIADRLNSYIEKQNLTAAEMGIEAYKKLGLEELKKMYEYLLDTIENPQEDYDYKVSLIRNYLIFKNGLEITIKINGGEL